MKKIVVVLLALLAFTCSIYEECDAAKFGSLGKSIGRHTDDVAAFGKKSRVVLHQADKAAALKRWPELAKHSDDVIKGAIAIERQVGKVPAAARMIEHGASPVAMATLAQNMPQAAATCEKAATRLGSTVFKADDLARLPAAAQNAARQLGGKAGDAADAFAEMARRGGKKAVETAGKLVDWAAAHPKSIIAGGLLAWYLKDPQAAQEDVANLIREHVGGTAEKLAEATGDALQGTVEAAGRSTDQVLDTFESESKRLLSNHWPLGLVIVGLLLFLAIPALRRLPFNFVNSRLERINKRMEGQSKPQPPARGEDSSLNIYRRKRS